MIKFIDDLRTRSTNPECIPLTGDQQAEFIRFTACTAVKLAESPAFAATRLSIAVQDYEEATPALAEARADSAPAPKLVVQVAAPAKPRRGPSRSG